MKPRTYFRLFILSILLSAIIYGCKGDSTTTSSTALFFAQQKDIPNVFMEADLTGKLVLVDGCLRLQNNSGSHLIIWPRDFSLRAEGESIEILDKTGQVVARVGDNLMIAGGEVPNVTGSVLQPVPEECVGPYWLVGNEVVRRD